MSWTTTTISGKPADIFVPPVTGERLGVVLFLHGYDEVTLRDNEVYSRELTRQNLIAVCPHGPQCWWTDEIYEPFDSEVSPIQFLAEQIPAYCQETWQLAAPRIAVTGIEMGGQGALQLAYLHARQFPIVVAISPKIDFESWWGHGTSLDQIFPNREAARQRTAILHLHPLNYPKHQLLLCDPEDRYCIDGAMTLASKLSSTGILFEDDFQTTHGGFGWNYANAIAPRAIGFIADKLRAV